MKYVGIDPGKSGAIAVLDDDPTVQPEIMLLDDSTTLVDRTRFLLSLRPCVIVLERVAAMPKQGVTSSFNFGKSYGNLEGIVAGAEIPIHYETPTKWQTALRCRTGGDKNVSKREAQNRFPTFPGRITHAIADALLIATYCKKEARELFPQAFSVRKKKRDEQRQSSNHSLATSKGSLRSGNSKTRRTKGTNRRIREPA